MTSLPRRQIRASHFRPPKSRLGPSEVVEVKSDATVRLGHAISTGPPRFATIRDRRRADRRVTDIQTCGQTEVGVTKRSHINIYYSIGLVLPAPMGSGNLGGGNLSLYATSAKKTHLPRHTDARTHAKAAR